MASSTDLGIAAQNMMHALSEGMRNPATVAGIITEWYAEYSQSYQIMRRTSAWAALPPNLPSYGPLVSGLDGARAALFTATSKAARLAALRTASDRLDALSQLLSNPA
ncbi:MAG: hypothetical protein KF730_16305 [Sphingomonas sp.]|uniref:hypothetical protein n=1 Tax=Sphingomonas sp. TaxID=28214 RepID=UPI0025F604EE|nr:hypothetical protein [Sphingomonas sp.]MBX3566123.1 hypothetical protein [Sphingomonas sp.]